MKGTLTKLGKFSLTLAGLLLLAASVLAQVSLREALDFDGDNKADYHVFRRSNNYWYVLPSGGGFLSKYFNLTTHDYITPGDYDGDNKGDFSVWRNSDGQWLRYNSSNNTFYSAQYGLPGDEPVARDYDGDGKTDLAVVRRTLPSNPCQNHGYMFWYILRSSDNVENISQFGYNTDHTAPGDYDGDGKFDLAVRRPGIYPPPANCPTEKSPNSNAQSTFYIMRSSDNNLQGVSFSLSKDIIVPGDYDNDGKTDFAVVREGIIYPSNLIWHILQSTNGYTVVSFGLTGIDKTAQGDYDGDGKTDIAVWRETDGYFYVLRSTDGGFYGVQFGLYGDFPIASYDSH